jgi:hypothetical protein
MGKGDACRGMAPLGAFFAIFWPISRVPVANLLDFSAECLTSGECEVFWDN